MYNNQEVVIKNYSGLSTEAKPTIATGATIPNGSRWREVDTGDVWFYNFADDTWYNYLEYVEPITGHSPVVDLRALDVLEQMLVSLKKIEYHLSIATDADLTHEEI